MSARICRVPGCMKHAWHNSSFCRIHANLTITKDICPQTKKVKHSTYERAMIARRKVLGGLVLVAYICPHCNSYHLGNVTSTAARKSEQ